ncbi:MAG: dehydrogenase [Paenibacillus sp.]|nr:dehydrogenase [Paenibacillus sp.]
MSAKAKAAVIGAGAMANLVHYPSLASLEDVEIVGISDLNPQRLQTTADKYEVKGRYDNYRHMIAELKPDAVYAIGPPHLMYDIWVWCLEQGQNLYIEKPLGLTMHQARTLAYLAEKHGCITQVSFQRRISPIIALLREECLKRGPMVHTVCRFYKPGPKPYVLAYDHMMGDTVHSIDTVRWMCGGEIVRIEGMTRQVQTPDINFIAATLHFDNGSTGYLCNNWSSGRRIFSVEMHAPGICAEIDLEGKGVVYADGDTQGAAYDARETAGSDQWHVFGGFQAKHREFIDAIKAGRQPSSHFGDALKTMEAAEIILAQGLLASKSM